MAGLSVGVVLVLVAACNTQQLAGRGELVIAQGIVTQVDRWERSDELSDLKVAVEPRSRSLGASYCADGIGVCLNDNGLGAVQRCENSGKFECALFFYDHHVVWEGPVLFRQEGTQQVLPHNGVWSIDVRKVGGEATQATLYARQFKLSVSGLTKSGRCPMDIDPEGRGGGKFLIRCSTGPIIAGEFVVEGTRTFVGRNDDYVLTIQFAKGRQLVPNEELACAGCK